MGSKSVVPAGGMLCQLGVRNLAIARRVDVEIGVGMTVLTGETGAGKSILVDALGLLLGGRASTGWIAPGAAAAELTAVFEVGQGAARAYLIEQAFDDDAAQAGDDEVIECILRRRIGADGRSRCFINDRPASVAALRELGGLLVDIHGQHAHHLLMRRETQRMTLDEYAGSETLLNKCTDISARYEAAGAELERLGGSAEERAARVDLLRFQVEELDKLALGEAELPALDAEQRRLANGQELSERYSRAADLLGGDDSSATDLLGHAERDLDAAARHDPRAGEALELVRTAASVVQDASAAARRLHDNVALDPARLAEVESRLALAIDLARKHRVEPEQLAAHTAILGKTLEDLEQGDANAERLAAERAELLKAFATTAKQLHARRVKAAKKLDKTVMTHLGSMGMEHCRVEIAVEAIADARPSPNGGDRVDFRISTNPGQPLKPMAEVASGGELSRLGLALQVSVSADKQLPVLVFDEVDSGIGGSVAAAVGERLRALADGRQVLCVTHLAQVAACAHRQLRVAKSSTKGDTETQVTELNAKARAEELARMIGGAKPGKQALAHAKEMLGAAGAR